MSADPASGSSARDPAAPSEVYFYHLEHQPLERALPTLLERTLQRGWRAVVQAGTQERCDALDAHLWTYTDESFLPHGTRRDGDPARQPIYLTTGPENPNRAALRFMVDAAVLERHTGYLRIVYLFDGRDPDAVAAARAQWKLAKSEGCTLAYWQQDADGRWQQQA